MFPRILYPNHPIYGNIQGLKSSYIKQLQRLYEQGQAGSSEVPPQEDGLITSELAEKLTTAPMSLEELTRLVESTRGKVVETV